ncbi:alpha/beta hydrolase [Enterococcus casseliflavus]|uniref:alpha/beta hydrolase n=1 Tax=Enterococcus casseliflavus TaxID=37734 RepID=UPI001E3455B1|nr:alpha/beta hydrolase [Enterococcus casseliflavus]MCD4963923.1 alpha/beta hydrolase [Enterococcus casseliflavus]
MQKHIDLSTGGRLDLFLLAELNHHYPLKKRGLVMVIPGGGYRFTSDREAESIALWFNSIGLNSAVLRYRTDPDIQNIVQHALLEAAEAIRFIRQHVQAWSLDAQCIGICGFSAGGHIALQLATKNRALAESQLIAGAADDFQVDFAICGYPLVYYTQTLIDNQSRFEEKSLTTLNRRYFGSEVPSEEAIAAADPIRYLSEATPPLFLWHTAADVVVNVQQTLDLASAAHKHNVPIEVHIFEKGIHGLALANEVTALHQDDIEPAVAEWTTLCANWLQRRMDNDR